MAWVIDRLRGERTDARKTVTFGDASAVRNLPMWSVLTVVGLIVFWWVATTAWGLPQSFVDANPDLTDKQLLAACDRDASCEDSYFQLASPRTFPSLNDTWNALFELLDIGYRNISLFEHTTTSLWRVIRGMFFGIVFGVPIGFAMGLSSRLRSIFDGPVELLRPIPPLALIPLFILVFGIGDASAVPLLIFASIWIMIIAARSGIRTANLSKVRAAYSLGASKRQVLSKVLLPNALPELFTGVRVALGVSWGTLVAAELVGTDTGLGSMIFQARNFSRLDVVVVGIIIIAVLGVLMDVLLRLLEARLIPWRGKG
ncbi:MAG: ABC transporter permease [Actinomycetota bacterium]